MIVGVVFGVVGLCVARPSNILVTKQGIKLLDFGLAKQNAPRNATGSTITEEGHIVGTPRLGPASANPGSVVFPVRSGRTG